MTNVCLCAPNIEEINVREYRRVIKNRQSRESGNIGYTRRRKTKQKCYKIRAGHHYAQTNTNNVNKTWALLQTTGDEHHFRADIVKPITTQNSERRECSFFYNENMTLNFCLFDCHTSNMIQHSKSSF